MADQPTREPLVNEERAQARRTIQTRLAKLDREWTPERWDQATADHDQRIAEANAA
jgi:hypothetical protein